MKTKIFASLFCIAVFISYYNYKSKQQPQKASRALASVVQGFDFLNKSELQLLNSLERRDYLRKITQAIVKAGVFEGVFRDVHANSKVSSFRSPDFSFGISKAYALYHCPMYGLHPFVRIDKTKCSALPKALKISESSESLFTDDTVESTKNRDDGQSVAKCPEGQFMCNPALIGFEFEGAKAKLRCLKEATNSNCGKLKTSGDQMEKSLEMIEKANPKYWDEFSAGMEEQCLRDGKFNESDQGCLYAKKQINYSTRTYRNKLSQKYKDLAAKLNQQKASDTADKKVCKQFSKTKSELSLADHQNFNAPGFKIVFKRGQCWRLPSRTIVRRKIDEFSFLLPEGSAEAENAILSQPIDGVGTDLDRVSDVRFYNFQCGPCNDAKNLSSCVFNMRKPKSERAFDEIEKNKSLLIGTDDCKALLGKLETAELPDVVYKKAQQRGSAFYQTQSID